MGKSLHNLGNSEQARKHFWYSYLCNPTHPTALLTLAAHHLHNGDRKRAWEILQCVCEQFSLRIEDITSTPDLSCLQRYLELRSPAVGEKQ